MARKARARDYQAEYARRQAQARERGYESYYQRRVRLGGPPSAPKPTGERLARARGHRSAQDLKRETGRGDLVYLGQWKRGEGGRYEWVEILVLDAETGVERAYRLRGSQIAREALVSLGDELVEAGAVLSPSPSLDIRQAGV